MDKLKMHSPDFTDENIKKIAELFPDCVTESKNDKGELQQSIDFDLLKQELSDSIVEGPRERYQLNWPGKREALLAANTPITKTLRPDREESVDFDTTENLFIEGDNLDALKLLQETYLGKVKMIYIDPPYNTGKDFIYEDNFTSDKDDYDLLSEQKNEEGGRLIANLDSNGRFHSNWLDMMFPRLKLARNLLKDDGVIILSIDENEHANIKKICDEVFGSQNFCGEIVWKNSSKNDQSYISIQHEYFVIYVKDKQVNKGDWVEKKEGLEEIYSAFKRFQKEYGNNWNAIHQSALEWYRNFPESNPISNSKHYNWMDSRGVYFPDNISGPNDGQYIYDIAHPETKEFCKIPSTGWRYPESTMKERINNDRVHFGKDHTTVPNNKTYLKDTEYQSLTSMRFVDGRSASKRLNVLFNTKLFTNPKDEFLLKDLFKAIGVKSDDVVMDFFAGSGTTAHSVFELNWLEGSNCKSIIVQAKEDLHEMLKRATGSAKKVTKNAIEFLNEKDLPENIAEITKERIRRAGKKIKEENADKEGIENLDIGFRVLKIDDSNMKDIYYAPDAISQKDLVDQTDNIKDDRTEEDLLFQLLLDWGVDLSLPITRESFSDGNENKTVFFVDDNALAACFEKDVSEDLVKTLAKREPLRAVFRDAGYSSDSTKINIEQIFKLVSPATEVKAI